MSACITGWAHSKFGVNLNQTSEDMIGDVVQKAIDHAEISVKEIYIKTIKAKNIDFVDKKKFLSEIGWREFSYNLLYNYPNIQKIPIQSKFLKFPWINNLKHLKAWQEAINNNLFSNVNLINSYVKSFKKKSIN